jgi:hypothetical protein
LPLLESDIEPNEQNLNRTFYQLEQISGLENIQQEE